MNKKKTKSIKGLSNNKLLDWININDLDWLHLSKNPNPNAIHLLKNNIDRVDWFYLSGNPGAISILEKHIDKICWYELMSNPNALSIIDKHFK